MVKRDKTHWNTRFANEDTPWEESEPSLHLTELLNNYTSPSQSLLEIGCGLGTNTRWFNKLGYKVTAIDISEVAISNARKHQEATSNIDYICTDFLESNLKDKFDIVFDRACFHTCGDMNTYIKFAKQVSQHLNPKGIWINISGCADQKNDPTKILCGQSPRMTLKDIVLSIEPNFEILEIKRGIFGKRNNFLSWNGVYRKR